MYRPATAFNPSAGSGYELPEYDFSPPPELKSGHAVRHEVVIVGGGISGLTLACALAQFNVPCVLLDEDNTVGVRGASSRGICYAQKSLEIYKRLGIYNRIKAKGVQWSVGRTFAGADEVYSFDLKQQQTHNLSTQPAFINIQQFYIEGFLVDSIYELGYADLRWKNRVVAFEQNQAFATLTVETPEGSYRIEATHVIDATGVHSPFRRWLDMPLHGKKGDDRWCIADVRFKHHPPLERHTWIEAPFNENRAVWQHLMADDVWRLDYQMAPNCDMAEVAREDVVRQRLAQQFGSKVDCEIVWVGPYAYRSECLDRFRKGRVFFIGDSAHVVSPFGARGGNSGLQDADNLAWKLAAVVQGHAGDALLDSYDSERREAAQDNVRVTNRTARYLRAPEGMERVFRDATLALARKHPFARQLVNTGRMSVPNRYTQSPVCGAGGGVPVQNVAFEWLDGSPGELIDLQHWAGSRLLLLAFGPITAQQIKRLQQLSRTAAVRCVHVLNSAARHAHHPRAQAQACECVSDARQHLERACGVDMTSGTGAWALLRPDGYLAARGTQLDGNTVHAVACALGASEA
jgi:3-(3-hydroxy-phenyl)propionate hydroxylase